MLGHSARGDIWQVRTLGGRWGHSLLHFPPCFSVLVFSPHGPPPPRYAMHTAQVSTVRSIYAFYFRNIWTARFIRDLLKGNPIEELKFQNRQEIQNVQMAISPGIAWTAKKKSRLFFTGGLRPPDPPSKKASGLRD